MPGNEDVPKASVLRCSKAPIYVWTVLEHEQFGYAKSCSSCWNSFPEMSNIKKHVASTNMESSLDDAATRLESAHLGFRRQRLSHNVHHVSLLDQQTLRLLGLGKLDFVKMHPALGASGAGCSATSFASASGSFQQTQKKLWILSEKILVIWVETPLS